MSCSRIILFYITVAVLFGAAWIVSVECLEYSYRPLFATIVAEAVTARRVWTLIVAYGRERGLAEAEAIGMSVIRRRRAKASSGAVE